MAGSTKTHDRRTIMMLYKGVNPLLVSGTQYSRSEIADAFDMALSTVCIKLKGKTIATDDDLKIIKPQKVRRTNSRKLMAYVGSSCRGFEPGKTYTYAQIAQMSGIRVNAVIKRIDKSATFGANHIRPLSETNTSVLPTNQNSRFETYAEVISAQWLRRSIRVAA